jgi:tRNA(Arg) A34 adenosine deaminase TadA
MISETDKTHLKRCIALALEALEAGDAPFGSVLVSASGQVLQEHRNRCKTANDVTLHPEFTLAQWASQNLSVEERAGATVYTSGEHCPMCAAAHGYAGLGRIVYASSAAQFASWRLDLGVESLGPVHGLPINAVAPQVPVEGPVAGLSDEVKELVKRWMS